MVLGSVTVKVAVGGGGRGRRASWGGFGVRSVQSVPPSITYNKNVITTIVFIFNGYFMKLYVRMLSFYFYRLFL